MARTDIRYRKTLNAMLDLWAAAAPGSSLPSESQLADRLGVSRTIVRRCLGRHAELGIIRWSGRDKTLLRRPGPEDRAELPRAPLSAQDLEERFLDWVLRFDVPARTPLSVAELSRQFDVPQHTLTEFLAGLSRMGLVERRRQGGWMLLGFTRAFAVELSDFRLVLELDAIAQVVECPPDHPIWPALAELRADHVALAGRLDADFHEFSRLDERFHKAINGVVRNRFVAEFQKVISLIFHYHYMWDKTDERTRNAAAIDEHLAIIDALETRDAEAARLAARRHLRTSKTTLLSSLRLHDLG